MFVSLNRLQAVFHVSVTSSGAQELGECHVLDKFIANID